MSPQTLLRNCIAVACFTVIPFANSEPASAQFGTKKVVKTSIAAPKSVNAGKSFTVKVNLQITEQYHLQSNKPVDPYVPTILEVGEVKGFKVGKIVYPAGKEMDVAGEKLSVYEGKVELTVPVFTSNSLKPGKYTLPMTLKYQGCNDKSCFPPAKETLQVKVDVLATPKK